MNWTVFMPVLNEADVIESKLEHSMQIGNVVVVEGAIGPTYDQSPEGLSTDGTTEILKSYSDRILYIQGTKRDGINLDRIALQNLAMQAVHQKFPWTEILHRTDADEFFDLNKLPEIENKFRSGPFWLIYTDLINLNSAKKYRQNIAPPSRPFPFCPNMSFGGGTFHERFYRYRPDLFYVASAHALSTIEVNPRGQMINQKLLYNHPDYYFNRTAMDNVTIFHYKYLDGFKRLLKAEMSYLVEDEGMIPNQDDTFAKAKERLRMILLGPSKELKLDDHCEQVRKAKWFKYEDVKYDWNISLDEVLQ